MDNSISKVDNKASKFESFCISDMSWSSCELLNGNNSKQALSNFEYDKTVSLDYLTTVSCALLYVLVRLISEVVDHKALLNVLDMFCLVLLSV